MHSQIEKWKNYSTIGIILGSGLNDIAHEVLKVEGEISYSEIEGLKASTAPGHTGKFIFGTVNEVPIIAMQGRLHFYEGYSMADVIAPIKVLKNWGVETILITNAAGGINTNYQPGDLMVISDHINFMGTNPLIGKKIEGYDRFPDMSFVYDKDLRKKFIDIGKHYNVNIHEGTYLSTIGPSYETPAEIRAFRILGADAVGMSTVPEVIMARQLEIRVFAVSLISNMAAGILEQKLTEEEVFKAGKDIQAVFKNLISDFIKLVGDAR